MVTLADCRRRMQLEFFLGTARSRRQSVAKINLLIDVLTRFRDALTNESELIALSRCRRSFDSGRRNSRG